MNFWLADFRPPLQSFSCLVARVSNWCRRRLSQAFRSAAIACQLLEAEFASKGPLNFSHQEFDIIINDRATAPNTTETFETLKPELESFLSGLCGGTDFSIRPESEPRRRFGVSIKTDRAIDLAAIAAASV